MKPAEPTSDPIDVAANARIDEFIVRSQRLTGNEISERPLWNTLASRDAIRHFAYGTSDDNPLWLDQDHACRAGFEGVVAPPAFLSSVLYPFLHGAAMEVPLNSLIGEVEFEWFGRILEGDELRASARQTGVTEAIDRRGRRLVYILSETTFRNQRDEVVGKALGTMVRIAVGNGDLLVDRPIHRYSAEELKTIADAIQGETRTGPNVNGIEPRIGLPIPGRVRGPMTIGDLVCWQAAIGPSYRPGSLGYRDALAAPHTVVANPATGWPTKTSQQHEDFLLTRQRGMPAPFDNSLMRFCWIAPMITDWMGDRGFLKSMSIQTGAPILYGDTTWYSAIVTDTRPHDRGLLVRLKITGVNQLGTTNTLGKANVILPLESSRVEYGGKKYAQKRSDPPESRASESHCLDTIEEHARKSPDAIAVRCGAHALSYSDLDKRANQFGRFLQAQGAGRARRVGLLMDRSVETIVMILGILKAGATFVPVDPGQPDKRLKIILEAVRPDILMTEAAIAGRIPAFTGMTAGQKPLDDNAGVSPPPSPVIVLEEVFEQIRKQSTEPPTRSASPDDLAYVMTTSGTLSVPRAVAVPNRSLGAYVDALRSEIAIRPEDIYLHAASFSFSASIRQLFLPLSCGATLIVANEEERRNPLRTLELIEREAVTVWDTVPSVWQFAIDELHRLQEIDRARLLSDKLRLILSTGEALRWSIPRAWRHDLGHPATIINLYSQTETAGTVSTFRIPDDFGSEAGSVPLGATLPSASVHVLDHELQPVGAGEVGEVYVGGSRLAKGYLGRDDLTSERFIPDPLSNDEEARMYRTGDMARRMTDGSLQFEGRTDHRVKLRGQRIELAEVEEAIRGIPGIREVVAIVYDGPADRVQLVAYVSLSPASELEPMDIRRALRETLPHAQIPEVFVVLASLPRSAAGKIDRSALPAPSGIPVPADSSRSGAVSPAQAAIAEVVAAALGLERIDLDADFFDLGGNSLLAMRVMNELRDVLDADVSFRDFFDNPSVVGLAKVIEGN
jgi:amino acid adenylation domain-containing protein